MAASSIGPAPSPLPRRRTTDRRTRVGSTEAWPALFVAYPVVSYQLSHFTHDPLDVGFGRAVACDTRPEDRFATREPDLGHPCDLTLIEGGQEPGGVETVPRKAHQRQRRRVDEIGRASCRERKYMSLVA